VTLAISSFFAPQVSPGYGMPGITQWPAPAMRLSEHWVEGEPAPIVTM
jgi:hypothetical protein